MPSVDSFESSVEALKNHFNGMRAAQLGARSKWFTASSGARSSEDVYAQLRKSVATSSSEWEALSKNRARDSQTTGARLRAGWCATLLRDVSRMRAVHGPSLPSYVGIHNMKLFSWFSRENGVADRQLVQLHVIRKAGGST